MDAFEIVLDRLPAHGRIGVAERAELVGELLAGRVLESVRVHRVEAEAQGLRVPAQLGRIATGPTGCAARRAGSRASAGGYGAIVELVEDIARLAGAGEAGEAGAAGADAPGGTATEKAAALALIASMSMPRRESFSPRVEYSE